MENQTCNCSNDGKIVITCSGAADVGYVSDQVARKLSRNKINQMSCLALFSTCSNEKLAELSNKQILVIDGCDEDCGKKVMQNRGIEHYTYLRVTDLGYEKGKTPTSQDTIHAIFEKAQNI